MSTGLAVTLIEDPLSIQKIMDIPENHYDVCKAGNMPITGNAAGNTVDYLDLSGENESVKPLPAGFTARGIVALVFSCISAFLGMAVIWWYGMQPLGTATQAAAEHEVADHDILDEGISVPVAGVKAG